MVSVSPIGRLFESMYFSDVPLPQDSDFYVKLLHQAELEELTPVIYHVMQYYEKLYITPPFFQSSLESYKSRVIFQNMILKREALRILTEMDAYSIETIWLKGIRFIERYFGHLGLRATSDLDILVRQSDFDKAIKVLENLGFKLSSLPKPGHFHTTFVKEQVKNSNGYPLVVELHYALCREDTIRLNIEPFFERAEVIPGFHNIREFSEQDTFYYTCIHAANHGLKFFKHQLDIVQMLCREGSNISLTRLVEQAREDKNTRTIGVVLSTVYEGFPYLSRVQVLPVELQRFWTQRRSHYEWILWLSILSGWTKKWRYIRYKVFPERTIACDLIGLDPSNKFPTTIVYAILYMQRLKRFSRDLLRMKNRS